MKNPNSNLNLSFTLYNDFNIFFYVPSHMVDVGAHGPPKYVRVHNEESGIGIFNTQGKREKGNSEKPS